MKIKSPFRDYYDYVEYIYSPEGGDPLVVYSRAPMNDKASGDYVYVDKEAISDFGQLNGIYQTRDMKYSFSWLIVMDKSYLLVKPAGYDAKPKILNPKDHHDLCNIIENGNPDLKFLRKKKGSLSKHLGVAIPGLPALTKILGQPVYVVQGLYRTHQITDINRKNSTITYRTLIKVDKNIPNLGELGFASIKDAEHLYQELACYIGANINAAPEMVEISDSCKVEKHGFDSRKSFRHR